jgi:hypothetical protein
MLCVVVGVVAATALGSTAGLGAGSPRTYTKAQLAIMVLPKDRLGTEARGLNVSIGSGFIDNAAAADGTFDPNDTGRKLGRAGRIVGYDLWYDDLSGASFRRASGLMEIDSSTDLFKSAAAADAFITKQLRDARRLRGKRIDFGLRLAASSTFHVGAIGKHTVGLRTTALVGSRRIYGTLVGFRVGPLAASVSITRADAKSMATTAEQLARALSERIRLAGSGKLNAQPVPVPPIGKKGRPPPGGPDLAPMALSGSDLPNGAKVVRQGYVDDRDTLGSYEREFDPSAARFGASVLLSLESDISLFRSSTEAGGFFLLLRTIYTSPGIEQDLAKAISQGAGSKVGGVKIETRKSLSAGDESIALVVRYSIAGQNFRAAFVHLRVDRVIGTLLAIGRTSTFHFADVEPLAGKFAKRIGDGL